MESFKYKEISFAGETFVNYSRGRWESHTKTFATLQNPSGTWWCGSMPTLEFKGIDCVVDDFETEEEALKAAILRYYEIQVKRCEYELHLNKKILFEARGN